jgi:hypothetical protein
MILNLALDFLGLFDLNVSREIKESYVTIVWVNKVCIHLVSMYQLATRCLVRLKGGIAPLKDLFLRQS